MRYAHRSLLLALAAAAGLAGGAVAADGEVIAYNAEGRFVIPADYREWVFLTASSDLTYDLPVPGASTDVTHMLDNVFVNPAAYKAFLATGAWPDKTVLIKENRRAAAAGSISKGGTFQTEVVSMEFHVKDAAKFPAGWAFFASNGKNPGAPLPQTANCYTCHGEHGAVDTTFVQFYPTLLAIAKAKGTLSPAYVKAAEAEGKAP